MELIVTIFNVVYTCCTASYKAVSGLIKLLGFDKGENLFIIIFVKPLHYNWPSSIIQQIISELLQLLHYNWNINSAEDPSGIPLVKF